MRTPRFSPSLGVAVLVGCGATTTSATPTIAPAATSSAPSAAAPTISSPPTKAFHDLAIGAHGEECAEGVEVCGDLGYLPCDSAADGASFYMRVSTGETISTCGGACRHPSGPRAEVCAHLCPPPEWTCAKR